MLFQVVAQGFADGLLHGAHHFAVAKFGLGLTFELRLGHFDGQHGSEAFAEVLAGDFDIVFRNFFEFFFTVVVGVFFQRACQRDAESGQVCAAFDGVDVVDIRVYVLGVAVVVHDGQFYRDTLFFGVQVDDIVEQVPAALVDVAYKFAHAIFREEGCLFGLAFFVGAQVAQNDGDAGVQKCQFAHAVGENFVFVCGGGENAAVRPKLLACAAQMGFAYHFYGIQRCAACVFLLVYFAIAKYLRFHVCR